MAHATGEYGEFVRARQRPEQSERVYSRSLLVVGRCRAHRAARHTIKFETTRSIDRTSVRSPVECGEDGRDVFFVEGSGGAHRKNRLR